MTMDPASVSSNSANRGAHGVALITGASAGIGTATARRLAHLGYSLVLTGRRADRLEALATEIEAEGGTARAVPGDVTRDEDVLRAVEVAAELGGVEALIANAGIIPIEPLEDTELARWHRTVDTNLSGILRCVHAVLPTMFQQQRGDIVLLSSIAGRQTFPEASVYCATKAAINHFADCLRGDLAKRCAKDGSHLRVCVVQPGIVQTELFESIDHEPTREATKAYINSLDEPLLPEDIAETIAWILQSPKHVSINDIVVRPTAMAR
ncbi:MAG: SDR family oxidoreductase [Planctomycetota bacterium]|nr:SDR family oxidoreductase [Planctomycetota bacterium]